MRIQELHPATEHERVVECIDEAVGYHAIIAIHSTTLGPAIGGTRVWPYRSFDDALTDALRLSRGMSYKTAIAGLRLGGGKSVILADSRFLNREPIFRAHGRFINYFHGEYITGEDVGTSPTDMQFVRLETPFATGLPDRSGDPSPFTANGVFRAMQAAAFYRWQTDSLCGRLVAIQGCGQVGYHLALELHNAGARLVVSDTVDSNAARIVTECGATRVAPDRIFDVQADILAPCALGGILNDETIPRLQVSIVCGAANNQLDQERHGGTIEARGICYIPDYIANAGGIINGAQELDGAQPSSGPAIEAIYQTTLDVLSLARSQSISSAEAADRLAEKLLRKDSGRHSNISY